MRFYVKYTNRRHNTYGAGTLAGYSSQTQGWDAGVRVTCHGDKDEHDSFSVEMNGGEHAAGRTVALGTVHDTPDGPRWAPADQFSATIPGRVGSPAMEVIAAIPYGTEGHEFKCVVIQPGRKDQSYGVVSAYRNPDDDNRWHATGGHYDLTLSRAIRVMAERAGAFIRPDQRNILHIRSTIEALKADAAEGRAWPEYIGKLAGLIEELITEATR